MSWIVYELGPIDLNWSKLTTVRETVATTAMAVDEPGFSDFIRTFLDSWQAAKEAARDRGWEGDFSCGPCVFWLPVDTSFEYGFVFKQNNNGITFVVSSQELPHLARFTT